MGARTNPNPNHPNPSPSPKHPNPSPSPEPLVYRTQSLALRAWVEKTAEALVMRGALRRLANRRLSQCFESWQARSPEPEPETETEPSP